MDSEILPLLAKSLIDSILKEGGSVSEQSVVSNLEMLLNAIESSKPLTPTQRHAIAADRHIEDACRERDRMARELAATYATHEVATRELRRELTVVIDSHRDRLDWFEPNYEGLRRDYENIKTINFSSLVLITFGSVLMTLASFLTGSTKYGLLAAGIGATVYGLWIQWFVVSKSPISKERPAVRE